MRRLARLHRIDGPFTLSISAVEFGWDDDNVEHLGRHGISPDEVEELFDRPTLRRRGGTDAPDRLRVLGRTAAGRHLAIVYQSRASGVIRVITGWDMRPHERELYVDQIKG